MSDLAEACLQCGRPVHSFAKASEPSVPPPPAAGRSETPGEEAKEKPPTKEKASAPPSLDPVALARQKMERVARGLEEGANRCLRCGQDVTMDVFRSKEPGGGYVCAECRTEEMDRVFRVRSRFRRWIAAVVVVFVVSALVFGAMSAVGYIAKRKPARTIR